MNFIVIGQEVEKLSEELKERNSHIDWNKIYGLRNIIVHHYFGINVDTVWQIIKKDVPKFMQDLNKLIE